MKIFGIVAEYNPLHLNHIYQIEQTKKLCGEGYVVCVMSGNFCQRGEPAVMDKFDRAKHAILSGADAVIELPTIFAVSSAENFALGAIKILNAIKADAICCGSEIGNAEALKKLSRETATDGFFEKAKTYLDKGFSYAASLSCAEKELFGTNLLESPNNLLAIEYLKAMQNLDSTAEFFTVKRTDRYNCDDITKTKNASSIRKCFYSQNIDQAKDALPDYVYNDLKKADFSTIKKFQNFLPLFLSSQSKESLEKIEGVFEGIENRILESVCSDFDKFIDKVKTKRYTRTKLNRLFLNCVLNITKEDARAAKILQPPIKILAAKQDASALAEIKMRLRDYCNNENDFEFFESINQRADSFYYTISNIVVEKTAINKIKKY